ncbi:hypothetical protein [Roseomonas sp. KE0001]|uniref:hypothetical protein n=1 Tax=unclassified Roseomonas TaxID=2617492 RepID=UPI0018DF9C8F|nr:hypothetical protein [Roseomonas sp. KE0001]MBI0434680.1 hypothetical protein [Roseomonas sp. KE0001]
MPQDLRAEFRACLARAGISVPPEREPAMYEAYLAYAELASVLDEPYPYAAEPAAVFTPAAPGAGRAAGRS